MDSDLVLSHLQDILKTSSFVRSPAMSGFLSYVVREALAGKAENIKAYTIAVSGLGSDPDFDPQESSKIRMLANRLRRALDEYYKTAGAESAMRIELPKGGYAPVFRRNGGLERSRAVHGPGRGCDSQPPRIVVAPFKHFREDPEQGAFAHELAERMTEKLTSCREFIVTPYALAMDFSFQREGVQGVQDRLGARYAVIGDVRFLDSEVRVRVSLIDCLERRQLWAASRECGGSARDLWTAMDRLVQETAVAAGGMLATVAAASSEGAYVRTETADRNAMAIYNADDPRCLTCKLSRQSIEMLEAASDQSPGDGVLHAMLVGKYVTRYALGFMAGEAPVAKAGRHLSEALMLSPNEPATIGMEAYYHLVRGQYGLAMESCRRLDSMHCDEPFICWSYGLFMSLLGEFERGLGVMDGLCERCPVLPGAMFLPKFLMDLRADRRQSALDQARRFRLPGSFWEPLLKVVALSRLGRQDEARMEYGLLLERRPDFPRAGRFYVQCFVIPQDLREVFFSSLRQAGWSADRSRLAS